MTKTVIFDLGGVYFTDGTNIGAKNLAKKYNLNFNDVLEVIKSNSEIGTLYRRGQLTANQFWNKVKEKLNIEADNKDLQKLWQMSYKQIPETVRIIKHLRRNGVSLYYLSDNVKERVEDLERRYRFLGNFKDGVFSHVVHKTKVDGVSIFKLVIKKTGKKAQDLVYVEDKEEHVKTARKLGMNVIHFKTHEQFRKELENLLGEPLKTK